MIKERSELKSIGYEIFIGILSILSIVNLVLWAFSPVHTQSPFLAHRTRKRTPILYLTQVTPVANLDWRQTTPP
jgi:hypothetical protein